MNRIIIVIMFIITALFPLMSYSYGERFYAGSSPSSKVLEIQDYETFTLKIVLLDLSFIGIPNKEYWEYISNGDSFTLSYVIEENAHRSDGFGISLNNQLLSSSISGAIMDSPLYPSPDGVQQYIKFVNGSEVNLFIELPQDYYLREDTRGTGQYMVYYMKGGALGMKNTWYYYHVSALDGFQLYEFHTEGILTDANNQTVGGVTGYRPYFRIYVTKTHKTLHLKTETKVDFGNIIQDGVAKETEIKLLHIKPVLGNQESHVHTGLAEFIMESEFTANCGGPKIKFDSGMSSELAFNTYYDLALLNHPLGVQWVSSGNCSPGPANEMRRFTVRYK
ncbi:Uncharacterised protein [Vibrio cincinnatiensis]|uniref:Uncharacterized protein n=1 Tax=Vibrio cincinnatiensis DSM 19608 TaxID=1123491 RepID=A0A1T4NSV1_VIBCI|nr:hypothetical protein [Vibrio cincinnatiensis]SJZ82389.1 hypothetical protein SAMN02745782_01453 [Vibrio cincinnatiensis DSM 19608]SUP05459.1 Uncharacterised protein [Vibrio cincinnatiensis]